MRRGGAIPSRRARSCSLRDPAAPPARRSKRSPRACRGACPVRPPPAARRVPAGSPPPKERGRNGSDQPRPAARRRARTGRLLQPARGGWGRRGSPGLRSCLPEEGGNGAEGLLVHAVVAEHVHLGRQQRGLILRIQRQGAAGHLPVFTLGGGGGAARGGFARGGGGRARAPPPQPPDEEQPLRA